MGIKHNTKVKTPVKAKQVVGGGFFLKTLVL